MHYQHPLPSAPQKQSGNVVTRKVTEWHYFGFCHFIMFSGCSPDSISGERRTQKKIEIIFIKVFAELKISLTLVTVSKLV